MYTYNHSLFHEGYSIEFDPTKVLPPDEVSLVMGADAGRRVSIGHFAKDYYPNYPLSVESVENPRILDVGCGSGVIAIGAALLCEIEAMRNVEIVAFDNSADAIACSAANFSRLEVEGVKLHALQGDWDDEEFIRKLGIFDEILINPPYLPPTENLDGLYESTPPEATTTDSPREDMARLVRTFAPLLRPMGSLSLRSSSRVGQWVGMEIFPRIKNPDDFYGSTARLMPLGPDRKLGMVQVGSRYTGGFDVAFGSPEITNRYAMYNKGFPIELIDRVLSGLESRRFMEHFISQERS